MFDFFAIVNIFLDAFCSLLSFSPTSFPSLTRSLLPQTAVVWTKVNFVKDLKG